MLLLLQKATERNYISGGPIVPRPLVDPGTGTTDFDNEINGFVWSTCFQNGWELGDDRHYTAESPSSVDKFILSFATVTVNAATTFSFKVTAKSSNVYFYTGNIFRFLVYDPSLATRGIGYPECMVHDTTLAGWYEDHEVSVELAAGTWILVWEYFKAPLVDNAIAGSRYDSIRDLSPLISTWVNVPYGETATDTAVISELSEIGPIGSTISCPATGEYEMEINPDLPQVGILGLSPTTFAGLMNEIGGGVTTLSSPVPIAEAGCEIGGGITTMSPLNMGYIWEIPPTLSGQTTDIYICILTGAEDGLTDLTLPISSFNARMRDAEPSYLGAVIPNITTYEDDINDRENGDIEIWKGFRDINGIEHLEKIIDVNFDYLRLDEGSRSASGTLVGYRQDTNNAPVERIPSGVQYRSVSSSGTTRLRCDIDLFMRPGDTCVYGDETFTIDQIDYIAMSASLVYMEVAE